MTETDMKKPSSEFLMAIDIHELLQQQEPFVMIGRLTHFDMRRTVTETIVGEDNIFTDDGLFSASGLIENIAQTCAARLGYVNKYILKNNIINIGYIGAIRNLEVLSLPMVGDRITTTVDVSEEVFGMTLANATVECNGKVIAKTEMKIAVREERADE
jgi:3-hydroxymyristoyl/3-hydroxydecanoyl-(acyl carrier protein) dehydratase